MSGEEVSFGRFRFDLGRRELSRDGIPVRLGSRALDVLCVLATARGNVITKDELLARVWPGQVVEENNLQVQVSALRKALDEEKSGQSYLVTVPGRGYRLIGVAGGSPGPALPDKPSIAVLPFQNMSDDPQQEYFADGIVEEIIAALCHMRWLFVIARDSSFAYKGRTADVKQVGRELGVRYVVEGGIRKAAQRVRITAQLIDASTGAHLWSDHFDGGLEDIFDLQDQVAASVVGAIAPKLEQAEIERAKRKPTESLDAYDYFLRGMASLHQWTKESNDEALRLFYKSIELDPGFASAYGMAAWSFVWRKVNGWMGGRQTEIDEAGRLARRAIDLGAEDAVALSGGGYALVFVAHDVDRGAAYIDRALALNPKLAWALHSSGWTKAFLGEPDAAIKLLTHAMRLNPLDPLSFRAQGGIALAHFLAGRYDEAALWAEKALRERPNYPAAIRELAAANALAGHLPEDGKQWPTCAKLIGKGAFPRSRNGSRFGGPPTSQGWSKGCE